MVAKHDYQKFLATKSQAGAAHGFDPLWLPDCLFDFQHSLAEWHIRKGRAATIADCGLGKTILSLVFAENVVRHTNGRMLILTPLAVAPQFVAEGERFGVGVTHSRDGRVGGPGIYVANYERLRHFDRTQFVGLVGDEASGIKDFEGKRKAEVTEFMRPLPYRGLYSATAAPNDFDELGTLSEAIGEMGYMDMVTRFFEKENRKDYLGWGRATYQLRGHAEEWFWRWVCSWARAVRRPSDLGFPDDRFTLPGLVTYEHVVGSCLARPGVLPGMESPARTLPEQRAEQRQTLRERCERVAELVADTGQPAVCWVHLNDEGDLVTRLIPGAVQVSGADSDEKKEEQLAAFTAGQIRVLVTKPQIAGYGLNWQHCAHMTFFPSHSFERYYQAVRRCWRFGQTRPVVADVVTTPGAAGVLANLKRKQEQADRMFARLTELMNSGLRVERANPFTRRAEVPTWMVA